MEELIKIIWLEEAFKYIYYVSAFLSVLMLIFILFLFPSLFFEKGECEKEKKILKTTLIIEVLAIITLIIIPKYEFFKAMEISEISKIKKSKNLSPKELKYLKDLENKILSKKSWSNS